MKLYIFFGKGRGYLKYVNWPILHCKDGDIAKNSHKSTFAHKKKIVKGSRYSNREVTML